MAEQVISVSFGKETFATTSVSLSAFVVVAPFERTLPSKTYKRQGACVSFPASAHPEINGCLYVDAVRIPDDVIMILQCSHKMRSSPVLDGAILLRTRTTGPMLTIHAALPVAREALTTGDFLVFQGRADVLTKAEAEDLGLEIPKHWAQAFLDKEEVKECYTISELSPALAAKPTPPPMEVLDVDGEKVKVRARAPRRLGLRRRT